MGVWHFRFSSNRLIQRYCIGWFPFLTISLLFEPHHEKTCLQTCGTRKDSNRPVIIDIATICIILSRQLKTKALTCDFVVRIWQHVFMMLLISDEKTANEPSRDKTNNVVVRPAKTQISLGIRPVWSVFAVRMKKAWVLSYPVSAQRRLWSAWADAQADLSLRWTHTHFVGFVTRRLKLFVFYGDDWEET